MKYNPEDYEFAIRVLHHRKGMDGQEVAEWMKDSGHMELLREIAAVRLLSMQKEDIEQERRRLYRKLYHNRRIGWMSAAAVVLIALGVWQILRTAPSTEIPVVAEAQTAIIPGDSKALLILADGRVVDLQASVKEITEGGSCMIRNDSVDGLRYQSEQTGSPDQAEEYNVLRVPVAGFYKLILADGTKVWLNADSELRYPVRFGGQERNVYLKGEGYFEVASDEGHPFQVHLPQAVVKVLGTRFNISAYADEESVFTTLVSGSVEFRSEQNAQKVILKPGSQSVMDNRSGKVSVRDVDVNTYTAWVAGRFVFRFMDLETIMRQLQRWYDFDITWLNSAVKEYEFQGVIQKDSRIEDVFKAIELTTDVNFKITGKQVTIEKR